MIVILGALAAFALPRLDWLRFRMESEVRAVAMELSYAQRLAVTLQHDVRVTVDRPGRRLVIDEDADNDGNPSPAERQRVVALEAPLTFDQNGAPSLPAPSPINELVRIVFRRDGSANQSGVIYLTTARAGGQGTDARVLEIVRATGRAFWYRQTNSGWVRGN